MTIRLPTSKAHFPDGVANLRDDDLVYVLDTACESHADSSCLAPGCDLLQQHHEKC